MAQTRTTDKKRETAKTRALVEDGLKRYLADIRKYPILSKPEEQEVARAAR